MDTLRTQLWITCRLILLFVAILGNSLVFWCVTSHVGGMTCLSHQNGVSEVVYQYVWLHMNKTYGGHIYCYLSDIFSPSYYVVGVLNLKGYID